MNKDLFIAVIAFVLLMFLLGRCVFQRLDDTKIEPSTNLTTTSAGIFSKDKSTDTVRPTLKVTRKPTSMPMPETKSEKTGSTKEPVKDTRPFVDVN